MLRYNKNLGDYGEKVAVDYLVRNEYEIVDQNYRCKFGELDIISRKDFCLIFIEVKTRSSTVFGAPIDSVRYFKLKTMVKCAKNYVYVHKAEITNIRFDVIEVLAKLSAGRFVTERINHIKDAILET